MTMPRIAPLACAAALMVLSTAPAHAQHAGHHHEPAAPPSPRTPAPTPTPTPVPAQDPHAHHGAMQGMDHSAHGAPAPQPPAHGSAPPQDHGDHAAHGASGTADEEIGNAAPPPVVPADAADRFFLRERMIAARDALGNESRFFGSAVLVDWLEYRAGSGADGYAWEGEGWIGGDIDRLAIATEGEGTFGEPLESAEVRAVWRHAIDPYFNLEAGLRQDFGQGPDRTYASIGIDGLAPYWFDVEGTLFLSDRGDVHARVEGSYDLRVTNRLILQPAVEVEAAMQDVPELGLGAGLTHMELGARLRYQITRQFSPYVGVHWERKLGETANRARADGERVSAASAVVGVRAWF